MAEIMAADVLSLGLDAAAGGVFGLVGTIFGRVAGYFERKLAFTRETARWSHELELHKLQMQARVQEAEIELAIAAQHGSWQGLQASIEAEAKIGTGSQWVINSLRLVRPLLTVLLWLITAWIFAQTQNGAIVEAAIFAATAATLWWFGDRAPKPAIKAVVG